MNSYFKQELYTTLLCKVKVKMYFKSGTLTYNISYEKLLTDYI